MTSDLKVQVYQLAANVRVCDERDCTERCEYRVDFPNRDWSPSFVCGTHALPWIEAERIQQTLWENKKGNEMEKLRWEQDNVGYGCAVIGCPTTAIWRLAGCMDMPFFCTLHVWELNDLVLPAYVVAPEGDAYTVKFRTSSGDLDTFMTTRRLTESEAARIAEILNRGYGE